MTADNNKLTPVRLVFDRGEEVDAPAPPPPPPPEEDEYEPKLPEACPVVPLGVLGDTGYFLDDLRQLRAVAAREMSRLGILALFGRRNHLLYEFWPRRKQAEDGAWITTGWRPELAQEALMSAAARKGVWNPFDRVRGCGSWLDDNGGLLLHCGDTLIAANRRLAPGVVGRYVYPAAPPAPQPWPVAVPGEGGPAATLLSTLQSWNWRRRDLDALLLLGWIGAAMIGGAIDWRPCCWITGGKSTGKSTLQKLLQRLFDGALISVSDASAAGVWQKLGHATVPVAIDELEAEEDNRQAQRVVKLARQAASGGLVLRGGADHTGSEFMARSCFLFSSVLMPPLLGQDRSRMAICELGELTGDAAPDIAPARLRELGQQLLRRLVDRWPAWNDTLAVYRQALADVGHGARGADVFGTLLAAADLLLHDAAPHSDHAAELAERLAVLSLAESDDDMRDEERCLQHLLTSIIPPDGSSNKHAVGEWVRRAAGGTHFDADAAMAQQILGTYGVKVLRAPGAGGKADRLAVANAHAGLARLFAGTHWASRSGTSGVWSQALKRLPMTESSKKTLWFAGGSGKATVLPLALLNLADDDDQRPPAAAAPHLPID